MRVIQVGVGGFGNVWLNCLKSDKRVTIAALVDVSTETLERARVSAGCNAKICYSSYEKALREVRADAVVCVTPPQFHRKQVVAALKAGFHVISEKPMATTPADCAAMLRVAKETGKTYVVSQNYRFSPQMYTLASLVKRGVIGTVGQVRIDFWKGFDFHGGFRHSMEYPVLVDMSIHHFDLLRFITGLNAVAVRGQAWNPPWSNYRGDCSSSMVFEMHNGCRAVYNASWCAKGSFCDWNGNWSIEGGRGTLTYDNGNILLHKMKSLYEIRTSKPVATKVIKKTGQAFVLDDFIRSIAEGRRPQTDVFDNIHSVSMVFAAVQAARTGKRVRILMSASKGEKA
jgi:predicted dehydrogenase